jgi:hypothetical protein
MKRKHLLKFIDILDIKIESDRPLTKTELVWCINHHAMHLAIELENAEAKRDHYKKIAADLTEIIVRHPEAAKELAASII